MCSSPIFPTEPLAAFSPSTRTRGLASGKKRASIWTASHGMRDMNDLVRDKPSGLALSDALAISYVGAIVARGNTGLFLLRPLSRPMGTAAMPLGD